MTEPQVITKNDNPNNPTPCRFVRTLPRCSQQLLSYESGGRYPALPAAQSMTTPMLATTTPMLATNNYYQARPDRVEAKKKPAPNAEAPEAGHGPKAARIKQLANHETNLHEHRHKEGEAAKQGQVAEHRCPAYQPLPKNNAHKSSGFQYT